MQDNMNIYKRYSQPPITAMKTIQAGRLKGMTDINPMWRIQSLTEAFGPCGIGWYYEVADTRREDAEDGTSAIFVSVNLYIKMDGEWSKPIHGTGGAMLIASEKNGLRLSDEAAKMAETDALGICCKNLGFGADVWWSAGRSKFNQELPPTQPQMHIENYDKNICYEDGTYKVSIIDNYLYFNTSEKGNDYIQFQLLILEGKYADYRLSCKMMLKDKETKRFLAKISGRNVPPDAILTKDTIDAVQKIIMRKPPIFEITRITKPGKTPSSSGWVTYSVKDTEG
jgi:hypothetical protein